MAETGSGNYLMVMGRMGAERFHLNTAELSVSDSPHDYWSYNDTVSIEFSDVSATVTGALPYNIATVVYDPAEDRCRVQMTTGYQAVFSSELAEEVCDSYDEVFRLAEFAGEEIRRRYLTKKADIVTYQDVCEACDFFQFDRGQRGGAPCSTRENPPSATSPL
jgi:hypothetical protein